MRFSVCIDTSRPWPDVLAIAQQLDAADWHCLYVCDHFLRADAAGRTVAGGLLEAWTTLTTLAARTQRVKLGTLVLGNTYRHPAVVANMAATLDQLSGGRLVLGLGAGWQANEHVAYGIDLPAPSDRIDRFEEACVVISSLLNEPRTTYEGRWYRLSEATCEPKPCQAKLPLLVGGGGRRTMGVAARLADTWHVWGTPAELEERNAVVDRLCEEAGRSPDMLRRASGSSVRFVAGRAADVVDELEASARAGVDEFIWRDDAATDVAFARDQLAEFAADVLPLLST